MFRSLLAFSLISSSFIGSASEQTDSFPLYYSSKGHPYVYTDLNKQVGLPMVLDTAATSGVLPLAIKGKLKLPKSAIQEMEVQGATGTQNMQIAQIEHTAVGSIEATDLSYVFKDLTRVEVKGGVIPGILGYPFLSQHCVDMDFTKDNLTLSKSQCSKTDVEGLRQASFEIDNGLIKIKSTFKGKPVDAILDTGAPNSYVNSPLFQQLNVDVLEKDVARGLTGNAVEKQKLAEVSYKIGNNHITENDMFVSDMPVFAALGYKDKPVLLLGLSYFKNNKLVIDYHANKIYF